jgi:hypothetical protein
MLSDGELVKAGLDAVLAPVRDTINRLLGPMADELSGILADPVRVFRFKRSVRLLEKVRRIADDAGFEPRAVPLKTLLPILENASLEEDEELHDRWASLLANAANPNAEHGVRPYFTDILRGLAADEAGLLNKLYDYAHDQRKPPGDETSINLGIAAPHISFDQASASASGVLPEHDHISGTALDNLIRLGLLQKFSLGLTLHLTSLGLEFVLACRVPKEVKREST